jgi:hypothetical protein
MDTSEKKREQWAASTSEDGPWLFYDTRVEAMDSGPADLGLGPGDSFTVVRCVDSAGPDLADLLAEAVESWVCDNAPDDLGEDYHENFSRGPAADDLRKVLADWEQCHGVKPGWFDTADEERITVPEPDSMKIDPDSIPF